LPRVPKTSNYHIIIIIIIIFIIIIIMAASSRIGNIDQEFFPYSIYYVKVLILKLFWV